MEEKIKEIIRDRVYGYLDDGSFRLGTLAERISDKSYFNTLDVLPILMKVVEERIDEIRYDHAEIIKEWINE